MQAEIDRRRLNSQCRFDAIINKVAETPRLNFVDEPLAALHELMDGSPSPIVVSFHTTAYFLIMRLLAGGSMRCSAIVNESIVRKADALSDDLLSRVDFRTRMTPSILRSALAGQQTIFIMADVFLPYGANAPLPFRDRALRYTISWAELAYRFRLPVVMCVLKDRGSEADVHLQFLPGSPATPYHLAFEMFRRFDQCLGDDDHLWENFPAMEKFGRPLPPIGEGLSPRTISEVGRLSLCDEDLASSIRRWLIGDRRC